MFGRASAAITAGFLTLVVGCAKSGGDNGNPSAASGQGNAQTHARPVPVADVGGPVTEEDAKAFGEAMEAAARKGAREINQLINWDALVDTATDGLGVAEKGRREFRQGVVSSVDKPGSFAAKIAETVAGGGSYDMLRVHEVDGRRRAMFRMIEAGGGVGYQDLTLARGADGKVRVVDIYPVTSAEQLSATFRRVFIPLAAHDSRNLLERLTGVESDVVKNLPKMKEMTDALNGNQPARALAVFDQLPASLKKEKAWEVLRIQAAQRLGDDAKYAAAIADFRTNHPNDPASDLQSIDYYLIKKQYEKALEAVNSLDKFVGGDPFLDVMRGNVYLMSDRPAEAKEAGDRAVREEPKLIQGYAVVVAAALKEKDFDAAAAALRSIKQQFGGVNLDAFKEMDGFNEFSMSEPYEALQKDLNDPSAKPASPGPPRAAATAPRPGPGRPSRMPRPPLRGRRPGR